SPVYAGCDVFALASRAEAFSLVLLEASLFGKSLIATDVGGAAEAVRDGETGFLVPPDDEEALVRAMRTLLADPAVRQRLGEAGAADARSRFGVEAMVAGVERAYADVLGAAPTLTVGVRALWHKRGPYLRALRGPRRQS
ncbi:MAG: glycosyltransferase, partial [Elioraea sp.]|nr:glycosyltransferase [Elioraea sp.]